MRTCLLNLEKVKYDIETWLREFVSQPQKILNGLPPCPYALKAWTSNKVKVKITTKAKLVKDIRLTQQKWDTNYDVVILVLGVDGITTEELHALTEIANDTVLIPNGLVGLEDHPNTEEAIGELKFNMGKYALVLIQESKKLNIASKELDKLGYYKNWPKEYLDDVVTWRPED
jgi:hypothetical protein